MIRVCSGFSPAGRVQYGERFIASFDRFWPASTALGVWVEEPMAMPRGACRDLWSIPGARELAVSTDTPAFRGREPTRFWKPKEADAGYSFRWDAAKFWKQCLIPGAMAAEAANGDIVVWLDGDVETINRVPEGWVEGLIGDYDLAYLGRPPKHSEIGFWAVRISAKTRHFLAALAAEYTSGSFARLDQWHSAYVWDHVRKASRISEINLTPGGSGHVWPRSPLAGYTRHDKGKRKPGGRA